MESRKTGNFICSLRKEKGYTQARLAEILNVSNRTVSKWEKGDGYPDVTLLPEIAKALGVTVDELLNGEKSQTAVLKTDEKTHDHKKEKEYDKKSILNFFKIAYVISLFLAVFSLLLGTVTELYCIWAFNILFYTHWEIMFAAVSLVALVGAGLVFAVGVTRLSVAYTKAEVIAETKNKGALLSLLCLPFPLSFIARIVELSRYGEFTVVIMLLIIAAIIFAGVKVYGKIR